MWFSILFAGQKHSSLKDGSRTTRPEIITSALRFSPTGRDWAVVSTQGLQIFSLDDAMLFAPTDLDIAITPQAVNKAIGNWEFSAAVNMALHLGEREVLKKAVDSVKVEAIELVVKSVDARMLKDLLKFVADEIVSHALICTLQRILCCAFALAYCHCLHIARVNQFNVICFPLSLFVLFSHCRWPRDTPSTTCTGAGTC